MARISFITTILNEEKAIRPLLEALYKQTKKPDEIIIADAGSSDNTINIIQEIKKTYPIPIQLIKLKQANRSQGRNKAIKKAKHEIIAVTDAGCIPDSGWLKNLTTPFLNPTVEVAAGYYLPVANTDFQKYLSAYTCVLPERVKPQTFLPSSRSIAFKKTVWQKVGGYPENLDTCEDLIFADRLHRAQAKTVFARQAIVHWQQVETFTQAFKQFYRYARGDLAANYPPHIKKIYLTLTRYAIGLIFLFSFPSLLVISLFAYLIYIVVKNFKVYPEPQAVFYLPAIQLTADLALISAAIIDFSRNLTSPKQSSLEKL